MNLDSLLQRPDIWRGGEHCFHDKTRSTSGSCIPTGNDALNRQLPGGGWPLGALTELLSAHHGIGELQLLMPALAKLSREKRHLAWITPPYLPYAPALAAADIQLSRLLFIQTENSHDAFWATEQLLRSGVCGAVLSWVRIADVRKLRRLQLAAESGGAMGVLFRPLRDAGQSSPAALRLQLTPSVAGITVDILKRRGGWNTHPVLIQHHHAVA